MSGKFFLVIINIHGTTALSNTCRKATNFLHDHGSAAKLIHRFKVTGEPTLLAVFEVNNITGLERNLNALSTIGVNDITCVPLLPFELFASSIGIQDPTLLGACTHQIAERELYWLEFSIDRSGLSQEELWKMWHHEAAKLVRSCAEGTQVDVFKVIAERKTHMFVSASSSLALENMCSDLPILQQCGASVHVKSRHVQQLDDYNARINSERLN